MIEEKFKYQELITLGFNREEINDEMFFNKFGYGCFSVTNNLTKKIVLDWDCYSQQMRLLRYDNWGNVMARCENIGKPVTMKIIEFFDDF